MVAMLGMVVGQVDKSRIRTCVGGSGFASLEDRGKRRVQRHSVTICRMELLALLVDAAECGRSCTIGNN